VNFKLQTKNFVVGKFKSDYMVIARVIFFIPSGRPRWHSI